MAQYPCRLAGERLCKNIACRWQDKWRCPVPKSNTIICSNPLRPKHSHPHPNSLKPKPLHRRVCFPQPVHLRTVLVSRVCLIHSPSGRCKYKKLGAVSQLVFLLVPVTTVGYLGPYYHILRFFLLKESIEETVKNTSVIK
jgi:hypothetical protein